MTAERLKLLRLDVSSVHAGVFGSLLDEALDEIERLQHENAALRRLYDAVTRHYADGDKDHSMIRCPLIKEAHGIAAEALAGKDVK